AEAKRASSTPHTTISYRVEPRPRAGRRSTIARTSWWPGRPASASWLSLVLLSGRHRYRRSTEGGNAPPLAEIHPGWGARRRYGRGSKGEHVAMRACRGEQPRGDAVRRSGQRIGRG